MTRGRRRARGEGTGQDVEDESKGSLMEQVLTEVQELWKFVQSLNYKFDLLFQHIQNKDEELFPPLEEQIETYSREFEKLEQENEGNVEWEQNEENEDDSEKEEIVGLKMGKVEIVEEPDIVEVEGEIMEPSEEGKPEGVEIEIFIQTGDESEDDKEMDGEEQPKAMEQHQHHPPGSIVGRSDTEDGEGDLTPEEFIQILKKTQSMQPKLTAEEVKHVYPGLVLRREPQRSPSPSPSPLPSPSPAVKTVKKFQAPLLKQYHGPAKFQPPILKTKPSILRSHSPNLKLQNSNLNSPTSILKSQTPNLKSPTPNLKSPPPALIRDPPGLLPIPVKENDHWKTPILPTMVCIRPKTNEIEIVNLDEIESIENNDSDEDYQPGNKKRRLPKRYKCPTCFKVCSKTRLLEHLSKTHEIHVRDPKAFFPPVATEGEIRIDELERRRRRDPRIECKICLRNMLKSSLKRHVFTVHKIAVEDSQVPEYIKTDPNDQWNSSNE